MADLRGGSPLERALAIIDNCAHPDFREPLYAYVNAAADGHTPHTLEEAFSFHDRAHAHRRYARGAGGGSGLSGAVREPCTCG